MSVTRVREDGLVWLVLDGGKGNIIDAALIGELIEAVGEVSNLDGVRLLALSAVGRDFSWGASVPEHRPSQAGAMLAELHRYFRLLEATGIPTACAVRGRCLGGGLEVAAWAGRIVCTPDATLALPEIKLGVFPPIGTLALQWRLGGPRALEAVLTGRSFSAAEAAEIGLVDAVADDPEAALRAWYTDHLVGLSASSLRFAWRAARLPIQRLLHEDLVALERLYLSELIHTHDANEGIEAFLQKRPPTYLHR